MHSKTGEEKTVTRMADRKPPPLWRFPGFWGEFGDPYLEETDLETGTTAHAASILEETLSAIVEDPAAAGLELFDQTQVSLLDDLRAKLQECQEISVALEAVRKPEHLQGFVQEISNRIANLAQVTLPLISILD